MNLNLEPKIIGMANSLDLDLECPVDAVRNYCREKVSKFLRRAGRISNINELQKLICKRLDLTVHEIWSDADLIAISSRYRDEGEIAVFAGATTQLKPDTFGVLMQFQRGGRNGRARYVAFIDCRGDKHLRRVFTLWHEIAHCLTAKNQLALPLRRTTVGKVDKDPEEKLTDIIAADFAFYEPLFAPILKDECASAKRLTFRAVERIRDRFNPDASFASTLNACLAKSDSPMIMIEAGLAFKKAEQKQIDKGAAVPSDFEPKLRVLISVSSEAARDALPHVPKQMRVPEASIIARIFASNDEFDTFGSGLVHENLGIWTTSSGDGLPNVDVVVEARKVGDRVLALISARAA